MGRHGPRELILEVLVSKGPLNCRELEAGTGLSRKQIYNAVNRAWRSGVVLRTEEPVRRSERVLRGRAGASQNMRQFHRYMLRPEGVSKASVDGSRYVEFSEEYLDPRGGGGLSKAQMILDYLVEHGDEAFFSADLVEALGDRGIKGCDIMSNVRRHEAKGLVYVRGYKSEERETPFKEGFLMSYIDQELPRDDALKEAIGRTDVALQDRASSSPTMERIHRIRDIVLEHSHLRKIVSKAFIEQKLKNGAYEVEFALERALQLYPDMKVVKLFNAYNYYYHQSLAEEDLSAALKMKRNYIRKVKGRDNRIGHNWEAVADWFIDKFTTGARFWTQSHRQKGMDSRRITLHLFKSVGGRRSKAEVDRVWEITPGVFASPITYVLSCKWGLVHKKHIDDFLEVLRWSKDFGVDTEGGREIKNGIVGVFAASAFNPKDNVYIGDEKISLAQYASRRQLQLVTAADFNEKMRERGVNRLTVQAICRVARAENQVRETLDSLWRDPERAGEIMKELRGENEDLYKFEQMLESEDESPNKVKDQKRSM